MARAQRFKPFERDGHPVAAEFDDLIQQEVQDYVGPQDRHFAAHVKPRDIRIAMLRTGCFGTCPAYWVEVRGDGRVSYQGYGHVLVEGEHRWQVSPVAVAALVDRFRQADYIRLKGYYSVDVTDLPSTTTRLSLGRQHKFVYDYGGALGRDMAAQGRLAGADPAMPEVVTELEDAIDAVAGTASWVRGDDRTLALLRRAKWNFHAPAAGRGLGQLLHDCQLALATEFIRAGAPLSVRDRSAFEPLPVATAVRCGDAGMVRLLAARGALKRGKDAAQFLAAAARHGYPEFVEIGLKQAPKADRTPLLFDVAGASEPDAEHPGDATYDPGRVVALLLAAGANVHVRNEDGVTALHKAQSDAVARALIAGGADVNARNQDGETPLFGKFFDEPMPALIEAGADLTTRDNGGGTALFHQRSAVITRLLIRAGMDVNAIDKQGMTPLETATEEAPALVLLEAGAALPTDPERLAALTGKAKGRAWTELLQRLALQQP